MFPAWRPGGALLTRPAAGGGATPMLPKNGWSGISMPVGEVSHHPLRVERDDLHRARREILRQEAAAAC